MQLDGCVVIWENPIVLDMFPLENHRENLYVYATADESIQKCASIFMNLDIATDML